MSKHQEFWKERWQQQDIPFHQPTVNQDLPDYWSKMQIPSVARVLVPLCGKSLDMIWLQQQGYKIIGIELSDMAVKSFFHSIQADYQVVTQANHQIYKSQNYEIWVTDIFTLNQEAIEPVDAIYDRGALIALPLNIRARYVSQIWPWLKANGQIFLKTTVYDQAEMEGPPYAVCADEVAQLYKQSAHIEKIKSTSRNKADMQRYWDRGCRSFKDETWIITK